MVTFHGGNWPMIRVLSRRASSSLMYSSIPSKSFSFLWTVTWRLRSCLDLFWATAAWEAAEQTDRWWLWIIWLLETVADVKNSRYLLTPEPFSCRSGAAFSASAHSFPVFPPALWGPTKQKCVNEAGAVHHNRVLCVETQSLTRFSSVRRVISCWTLYSTLASGDNDAAKFSISCFFSMSLRSNSIWVWRASSSSLWCLDWVCSWASNSLRVPRLPHQHICYFRDI